MEKRKIVSLLISAGVGLFVLTLWLTGVLGGLENKSMDMRFNLRGDIEHSSSIAIVCADEESIANLGRWPWPRSVHAKLVDRLTKAGAKSIVFDVLFLEPDLDRPEADRVFARAIRRSGRVTLGAYFQKTTSEGNPTELSLPTGVLLEDSQFGFTNIVPEMDGVTRRVPLMNEYNGKTIPSLGLSGLSQLLGKTPSEILREYKIPLNDYNEMLINYSGGFQSFPYYSFHKVLEGKVADQEFKDKIVLIGGTAAGLFDFKAIPFAQVYPGVEVHANAMSNILLRNYLIPWPWYITFFIILCFALSSGLTLGRFSTWKVGISMLGVLLGYCLVTYYLFVWKNVSADFVAPVLSLFLGYSFVSFYNFMKEEKEKKWVKKALSNYLSARVMESVLADPAKLRLGGQRENLTVLFSDIRGFTTISEALKAEEVVELLNEYFSRMVEVVFRYDGTLNKFIGDALMAFWGAPVGQQDHPERAVLCALDMMEELKKLQEKWRSEGKTVIDIGIGISTGEMIIGNMGSKDKMDYTVIGDTVNLGSRLEGLNKEYDTNIIISASTHQAVKELVETKALGSVKVKGKEKAVHIYAVTGRKKTQGNK